MKAVLTAGELAKALRTSESTISREARKGKIPGAHRVGGQWRFTEEVIDRWLMEEHPPKRTKSPPPRRRKRMPPPAATHVQRRISGATQVVEKQNENGKAHGIEYPMNEL
jgi:excisionase family DNA binding protein